MGHLEQTFAVAVVPVGHLEQTVVAVVQGWVLGQTVVAEGEQRLEQIFVVAAVVGQIVVVGEPHQVQIFVVAVGEVAAGQIVVAVGAVVAPLFAVVVEVEVAAGQTK